MTPDENVLTIAGENNSIFMNRFIYRNSCSAARKKYEPASGEERKDKGRNYHEQQRDEGIPDPFIP